MSNLLSNGTSPSPFEDAHTTEEGPIHATSESHELTQTNDNPGIVSESTDNTQLDGSSTNRPVAVMSPVAVFHVYRCWKHRKAPYARVYSIASVDLKTAAETIEFVVTWPKGRTWYRRDKTPGLLQIHRGSLDGPLVAVATWTHGKPQQISWAQDGSSTRYREPLCIDGDVVKVEIQRPFRTFSRHSGSLVGQNGLNTVYAKFNNLNRDNRTPKREDRKIAVWEIFRSGMDIDRLVVEHEVAMYHAAKERGWHAAHSRPPMNGHG